MTTMPRKTESQLEAASSEGQTGQKMFDNYGPVNIREAIGTFFLGVLAILLFFALQRSWNRYQDLLEQSSVGNRIAYLH